MIHDLILAIKWTNQASFIWIRCQIAVHQECYGVTSDQDFTSWVCRACETPDVERECCLCPIKGTPFDMLCV